MNGRRAWLVICLSCLLGSLSACQQTPDVPDEAKLLYYGPVASSTQISGILPMDESDAGRQVYIYDETTHKVVAVRTVDGHHRDLNFSWVQGHQYRVYFY
jgi:hypothetical protein